MEGGRAEGSQQGSESKCPLAEGKASEDCLNYEREKTREGSSLSFGRTAAAWAPCAIKS